ncbi:MAG: ABC transporter permease [Thermoplasmata archaeon]
MPVPNLLRLIVRNIRVNTDPASLVILLGLPAMYLVFFGYGFASQITSSGTSSSYLGFLTPGIMAYQAVMAGTVGGSMLWADRRFGMLAQLLVGPFTRTEYLFGIMFTAILFGLGGAGLMLALSVVLIGASTLTVTGVLVIFGSIALGSVFFGALMLLLAALVKSNNAYNSIQILVIFFVSFASTVYYPFSSSLPGALQVIFVVNPLTYIADTARNGYFSALNAHNGLEIVVLALETFALLALAVRAYLRSNVSMD